MSRSSSEKPVSCMGDSSDTVSDIEITAREIMRLKKELYDILCYHTGKDYATIEHDADRDYWLSAEEAKAYGLIDNVVTKR